MKNMPIYENGYGYIYENSQGFLAMIMTIKILVIKNKIIIIKLQMFDENFSVYDNFDENVDQKDTLTDNYVDDNVG